MNLKAISKGETANRIWQLGFSTESLTFLFYLRENSIRNKLEKETNDSLNLLSKHRGGGLYSLSYDILFTEEMNLF